MKELQECKVLVDEINGGMAQNSKLVGLRGSLSSVVESYLKYTSKGKWVHSDFGKSSKLTTM